MFCSARPQQRTHTSTASAPGSIPSWRLGGALALFAGTAAAWWMAKQSTSADEKKADKKPIISADDFTEFTLISKKVISPNTAVYRFALPDKNAVLPLPVASFILAKADIPGEDKPVVRPYTPITYDEKGYFELAIKSYDKGKLSKYIGNMKVGDKLAIKGPMRKLDITPNMKKTIAMIAGGSGITPMLQVAHKVLTNKDDKTKIVLIFGNISQDDILMKQRIDEWTAKYGDRFKVFYTLDKAPPGWKGGAGFITDKMITENIGKPNDDTLVLVCGPPGMMNHISGDKTKDFKQGELTGLLKKLGWNEKQVYKF